MREALRASIRNSRLSPEEVEESLGLRAGLLNCLFAGKIELRVAHVFGILKSIGCEPGTFFRELRFRPADPHPAPIGRGRRGS